MKKISIALAVTAMLSGCVDPNDIETETKLVTDGRVVTMAKSLVAERMRDPEATRFKNEFSAYQTNRGDYIVCGTVNAKNAMGGYVGYKPFYVRFRNNAIESFIIPGEEDQYRIVESQIRKVCAEAAIGKTMVSS